MVLATLNCKTGTVKKKTLIFTPSHAPARNNVVRLKRRSYVITEEEMQTNCWRKAAGVLPTCRD